MEPKPGETPPDAEQEVDTGVDAQPADPLLALEIQLGCALEVREGGIVTSLAGWPVGVMKTDGTVVSFTGKGE